VAPPPGRAALAPLSPAARGPALPASHPHRKPSPQFKLSTGPVGAKVGSTTIPATKWRFDAGTLDATAKGGLAVGGAAAALDLAATAPLAGLELTGPGAKLRISAKGVATFGEWGVRAGGEECV
jgi:hypothetical protein